MEYQEIRENNDLIAEFMGYFREEGHTKTWFKKSDVAIVVAAQEHDRLSSNYWSPNTNWNQLMEVIDKIESMDIKPYRRQLMRGDLNSELEGHFYFQTIRNSVEVYANIYYWQHDNPLEDFKCDTYTDKLTSTYAAVVAFIKWSQNAIAKNKFDVEQAECWLVENKSEYMADESLHEEDRLPHLVQTCIEKFNLCASDDDYSYWNEYAKNLEVES